MKDICFWWALCVGSLWDLPFVVHSPLFGLGLVTKMERDYLILVAVTCRKLVGLTICRPLSSLGSTW
jgi:hypothetical protein